MVSTTAVAGECPAEPTVHGLIGPLHEAIGTDGDDRVLHAVEQGFELALAGLDGGETFFDAAGVLSMAPATRPISSCEGSWMRAWRSPRQCGRRHRRCVEAASAPWKRPRHNQREKKCYAGGEFEPARTCAETASTSESG